MKKVICMLCCLLMLTGCAVSPYVIRVGSERIDASEAAFYLYANLSLARENHWDTESEEGREQIYAAALEQAANAAVIRIRCEELGFELPKEVRQAIREDKEALKKDLGGTAAYLNWLEESYMTDRLYDRLQAGNYYYEMLQDYVSSQLEHAPGSDELLRRFFAENYTRVRYIRLSRLDDNEQLLDDKEQTARLEQAKSLLQQIWEGASMAELMARWNDDPQMSEGAIVMSRQQAADTDYLADLFQLEENKPTGVYVAADGYYILERLPLAPNYYDENRETIFHDAVDSRFEEYLAESREELGVSVSRGFRRMDLDNLADYIR